MNYPFPGAVGDFWHDNTMTSRDFMRRLNFCRALYPKQINEVMFNFLDTHDTARVRESCKNSDELLQKLTVLLTMAGTPSLYYGTEIAMPGKHTPYNRSTMPWDEIDAGRYDDFTSKVASLVKLRSEHPCVKRDELKFIFDDEHPRLVRYQKENLTVYLNAETRGVKVKPDGKVLFSNCFDGETLKKNGILITVR